MGQPKNKDAKKALRALRREFGWDYEDIQGKGHTVGVLKCPKHDRDGCMIWVDGTASNTANYLWDEVRACEHGAAPTRRHW